MIFKSNEKQKEEARLRLLQREFSCSDEEYYAVLLQEYCSTCKRTKNAEEALFCSNPFHITIPYGYVMKDGRLVKIESGFDKTGVFTEENFLDLCKRAGLNEE